MEKSKNGTQVNIKTKDTTKVTQLTPFSTDQAVKDMTRDHLSHCRTCSRKLISGHMFFLSHKYCFPCFYMLGCCGCGSYLEKDKVYGGVNSDVFCEHCIESYRGDRDARRAPPANNRNKQDPNADQQNSTDDRLQRLNPYPQWKPRFDNTNFVYPSIAFTKNSCRICGVDLAFGEQCRIYLKHTYCLPCLSTLHCQSCLTSLVSDKLYKGSDSDVFCAECILQNPFQYNQNNTNTYNKTNNSYKSTNSKNNNNNYSDENSDEKKKSSCTVL